MAVIYVDNLSRRSITSAGTAGPGVAMRAMDQDLGNNQCQNYSMLGHYRKNCPNGRKHQQQHNGRQRTRGRQQKKNGGSGGGIWCSHHKTTTHRDGECRSQHIKDKGEANVATAEPSRVGMCSAFDLPEPTSESGFPYNVFSATEVTPMATST